MGKCSNWFRSLKTSWKACLDSMVIRYDSHVDLQKFYQKKEHVAGNEDGPDQKETHEEGQELEPTNVEPLRRCFCYNDTDDLEFSDIESDPDK